MEIIGYELGVGQRKVLFITPVAAVMATPLIIGVPVAASHHENLHR